MNIGYDHCRTDVYLPFDLTINEGETTEGSLTIKPGVAVGILGDSYIMATNGGTLLCVGNPEEGGLVRLTNSKSLSMNIESPQFGITGTNPFVVIDSSASEQNSIQFTRTTWLGWGILVGRYLTTPIQHNIFSLSYWGVHVGVRSGNTLFNNLIHENVRGAYAWGNTLVANCTFDRNQTGLEAGAGGEEELRIRDCLFTRNEDQGIYIHSGFGEVLNYYNAFWENGVPITGGSPGPGSLEDEDFEESPYANPVESGWETCYKPNQNSPVVNGGSCSARYGGLHEYSTSMTADRDVKDLDIGYHFATGQYADTDGDGMPDVWEMNWFGGLVRDGTGDYDNDGLSDLDEYLHGTYPDDANSDDDDLDDGQEVMRGGGAMDPNFPRGPYLHLVWEDEEPKIVVRWRTEEASTGAIRYRKEAEAWSEPIVGSSTTEHEVKTDALDPNTLYFYEVGWMQKGTAYVREYGTRHFWSPPDGAADFEFIVYGDNRGDSSQPWGLTEFHEYHAGVVRGILEQSMDYRFVLHVGDLVNDGGDGEQWNWQFFWPAQPLLEIAPLFPCLGNHEYDPHDDPSNYIEYFTLPEEYEPGDPNNERWYHFDYGDCRFICLDVNIVTDFDDETDDQREWLEEKLAGAGGKRIFVWFHQPPFSSGPHRGEHPGIDVRDILVPIFQDYGVQMVFSGHDHIYERARNEQTNTVRYIVTGGGGAPLHNIELRYAYPPAEREAWYAKGTVQHGGNEDAYHFSMVNVSPSTFHLKMYKWNGDSKDQWP